MRKTLEKLRPQAGQNAALPPPFSAQRIRVRRFPGRMLFLPATIALALIMPPHPKNAKNFSRPIDKCRKTVYTISCLRYLGVAQFGSVLEWGSRGRKFESSHPDQQKAEERENLVPRLFCAILAGRICAIPIAAAYPLLRPPTPARRGAKAFRERRDRKTAP